MKLLIDDRPLLILPQLAVKIGLNEAIVLQQIHWRAEGREERDKKFFDGHAWCFDKVEDWITKCFPFWSPATFKRTISSLKSQGLVFTIQPNAAQGDMRTWYRVNYPALDALDHPSDHIEQMAPSDQIDPVPPTPSDQNDPVPPHPSDQNEPFSYITKTTTNTKTTTIPKTTRSPSARPPSEQLTLSSEPTRKERIAQNIAEVKKTIAERRGGIVYGTAKENKSAKTLAEVLLEDGSPPIGELIDAYMRHEWWGKKKLSASMLLSSLNHLDTHSDAKNDLLESNMAKIAEWNKTRTPRQAR